MKVQPDNLIKDDPAKNFLNLWGTDAPGGLRRADLLHITAY